MARSKSLKRRKKLQVDNKNKVDPIFLILVFSLLAFGLVMLFSASFARALYENGNSFYYISKQGIFALLGVCTMFVVSKIDYHIYKKYAIPLFAVSFILLVLVLFTSGDENGIKRWIGLGPFGQFQPSELMKLAMIMVFSLLIAKNYNKMKTFSCGVLPFAIILLAIVALMYLEPHLSGIILMGCIASVMMFVGGTRLRWFGILLSLAALALLYLLLFKGNYMTGRAFYWLHPFSDPQNNTMQTDQSLLAIGSGGVFGEGLGKSRQKFMYLPEVQNDFIFSVVCEELGIIGAISVILLFVLFCYKGFEIASKAPDKFGSMLCIGIISQIGMQALLNIAVVTATVPNTGISLPFFSYGGTALCMQLLEMGIVLNVSRHSQTAKIESPYVDNINKQIKKSTKVKKRVH